MKQTKLERFRRPEFQEKLARARKFQRKSEPASHVPRYRFALVTLAILCAALIYFFVISPFFLVKQITLIDNHNLQPKISEIMQKLASERYYLVPKNHILLLTKSRVLQELQSEISEIKHLEYYKRIFPDQIAIKLEERKRQYIFSTHEKYYFLDQDGVAFEALLDYEAEINKVPLIIDESGFEINLGENLAISGVLNFLSSLMQDWPIQINGIKIMNFSLPSLEGSDLKVMTETGFVVYFDLKRDTSVQVKNLGYLLNSEIKSETHSGLSYIDMRLPNTGYYCFKDAPCALRNATSTQP